MLDHKKDSLSMDTAKIGSFLAALRKERGLTQEALGEQLGITNKTISRRETGSYLPPARHCPVCPPALYETSERYDDLCGEPFI